MANKVGWVHFRTDADLDERLDAEAERLRLLFEDSGGVEGDANANRSSVARTLLTIALGDDEFTAVAAESLKHTYAVTQQVMNKLVAESMEKLPEYYQRALAGTLYEE